MIVTFNDIDVMCFNGKRSHFLGKCVESKKRNQQCEKENSFVHWCLISNYLFLICGAFSFENSLTQCFDVLFV